MAGVTSLMCSYSKSATLYFTSCLIVIPDLINGTFACENDKIMNDIVKAEYGFRGCE